ncbi:MAG: hypothetical protein NWP83_09135, partial [Spirosomaceae bacterium]|nr:hypothetical protein [Spirosomataceae bacterium]
MKKYLQFTLLLLVGLFAGQELLAQSKPFYNRWTFTKVNDLPTRFKVYTSIQTKDSDVGGRGRSFLYDGAPSLATINNDIYRQAGVNANPFASHIGEFFLTYASFKPMPFILDYGFDDTDGDNRYHFEKTTWAYGDYLEDESPEIILAKNDEVYDCNLVKQNCRVYQRHYFNVPRDKIHENPDKGFTRSLIIRYYQGGKVAKTMIIPITVLGGFTQRESIGPGPLELKFVLRAPPGDASFSYIEKGQENSSEVVASATQSSSKPQTTTINSEVGYEAASGFGGSASSTLEMKTSTTRERGETNQTKFTVTTEDRIENKTGSDMFLFERNQYFYDKDFSVKAFFTNSGKVQMELQSKIVLRYVKKLQDVYVYENKIRSDSIPLYTATNQPKKAKFWQDVLALNKRAKENPVNIRPAQININNKEGRYIRENASAFTLSESLAITEGISIEVEGGISTPVSSVSVSQKTEYEFTTTNSTDKTQAAASRFTVGYYVEDTSPGDVINMQIADDPVFGMPIFKLASTSRTSCPFQPGTIQRDRPLITVENPKKADEFLDSAKYSDIESGKEVAFLVKVKNNSDSKETRIYRLRKFGERLPSMEYDQDEFALEYGQEKEFDVYVRNRRDIDVGYDNIFLVVEPRCNIAYYDGEGRFDDGYISDTIKLAAYWGATDKDRAPDNDDIETALLIPSDGRLVSTYKNIFGSDSKVSNRNATTFAGEQSLVPPTDCQKGWCAETTDG